MKKNISILILLIIGVSSSFSQQFYFKKYQTEDGLSHNTVWAIMQDSNDFLWFGTNDGLNRFDGYEFKVYKNNHKDTTSLRNNQVYALCEDRDKNIWIGTSKGIHLYNSSTKTFEPFTLTSNYGVLISSEVRRILLTKSGKIWIASLGQGFFIYDPDKKTLKQNSLHSSFVWDICEDSSGHVYVSSRKEGLLCFDQNGNLISKEMSFLSLENKGAPQINCIENIDGNIWFNVGPSLLGCLDPKSWKCSYYTNAEVGYIRTISKYSEQELLLGTDNGLYRFDIINETFNKINSQADTRGLSDQSILAIQQDREGGFWISTSLGGVNYLAEETKNFEYFHPGYKSSGESIGKVVNSFAEDANRNIWIGRQNGLSMLDNQTQNVKEFAAGKWVIQDLLIDKDNLWVATLGEGIKIINIKTGKIREHQYYTHYPNTISSNDVLSLYKDKDDNIYVGTTWGISLYNRENDNFRSLNFVWTMISVVDIIKDNNNNLWVASSNSGIFRLNSNGGWTYFKYDDSKDNTIGNHSVITLFKDSNGLLWLGTDGGGLYYYEEEKGFVNFDPDDKILASKVIYSIEEDNAGFLWLSTNVGLLKMNPQNVFDHKLFTQENGLQSNQFNSRASLKASNGKFYFGGINGLNAFFPDEFKKNMYIPPVYITGIHLYDKQKNELSTIDTNNLSLDTDVIHIPYNQNNIVIDFASLSYADTRRNKYCYKLKDYDSDWIYSYENKASYTKLAPGKYTFYVKASNNDGVWNEEGSSLVIEIIPPWWKSTTAYVFYLILTSIILIILSRYGQRKTDEKIKRQIEKYNTAKEKEIYQSKINFFVNLVHEIRTPLSLIKLPLEKLTESSQGEKSDKYLSIINRNIDYLLNIVSQLLDFQKTESKKAILYYKEHDINRLVTTIVGNLSGIMELKGISSKLNLPNDHRIYSVDENVISKILMNLISNAIKYAKTQIEITLEYLEESFVISVSDDGIGIADGEKDKIFEPFYQTTTPNNKGIGIGLTYSKQLAEAHNGTLLVEDNSYGGATFKLEVKTMKSPERQNTIENSIIDIDGEEKHQISGFQSCRILVVEDNEELLGMIADMLSDSFEVVTARNGKDALDELLLEPVDIVVSDVMMPEMDGFELANKIKSDINISHIPVILLTAKVTNEAKIEGMQQGADVYIEKPFSMKYLKMQIENLLKLRLSFQEMMIKMPLYATPPSAVSNKDQEFLGRLMKEIETHLSESTFSIDSIAEAMFMSRSNFYRKIKSITGMAPNDYLKTVRLNKAAELLLQDNIRIGDVYNQVGFSSSSYFAKCFKSQFGVSPRRYKEGEGDEQEEDAEY